MARGYVRLFFILIVLAALSISGCTGANNFTATTPTPQATSTVQPITASISSPTATTDPSATPTPTPAPRSPLAMPLGPGMGAAMPTLVGIQAPTKAYSLQIIGGSQLQKGGDV